MKTLSPTPKTVSKLIHTPNKKRSLKVMALLLSLSPILSNQSFAGAWDADNNPKELANDYIYNFDKLNEIQESVLPAALMPWSSDYYRDDHEGISTRHDKLGNDIFKYSLNSKKQLLKMTPEEIAELSPPEKLDIYFGDYNYSLTKQVRSQSKDNGVVNLGLFKIKKKLDRSWEGICHGWTSAAINHAEPDTVTLKNPDGIEIRFGSSDVKALLSYSYTDRSGSGYLDSQAKQVGNRCSTPAEVLKPGEKPDTSPVGSECSDLNAGTFHVVLVNQIAVKKHSFIADIDNMIQVWNQPISGYKTEVVPESIDIYPDAAPGTAKIVRVRTRMDYVAEITPNASPTVGTPLQRVEHPQYQYTLELNSAGEIIGGKWEKINTRYVRTITRSNGTQTKTPYYQWDNINERASRQHPDFFWIAKPAPRTQYWARFMKEVYKPRNFTTVDASISNKEED